MFQAEIDGTVSDTRNIVTASSQESVNHQFRPEIFIINLYHRLKSCCRGCISNPNTLSDPLSLGQATPLASSRAAKMTRSVACFSVLRGRIHHVNVAVRARNLRAIAVSSAEFDVNWL